MKKKTDRKFAWTTPSTAPLAFNERYIPCDPKYPLCVYPAYFPKIRLFYIAYFVAR